MRTHNRDGVIYKGKFVGYNELCELRRRLSGRRPTTLMDNSAGEISEIKRKIDIEIQSTYDCIGKTIV